MWGKLSGAIYVVAANVFMWCGLCGVSYAVQSMWQELTYAYFCFELRGAIYVVQFMWYGLMYSSMCWKLCGAIYVVGVNVLIKVV